MHLRSPACLALLLVTAAACGPPASRPPPEDPPSPLDLEDTMHGDSPPGDAPGSRAPTRAERDAIVRLLHVAERLRGLAFTRPVPTVIQDQQTIVRYVADEIDEEELEHARIVYEALGLLDPALDVRGVLVRVLGEQVVGYYDPEHGRLVVRDDVAQSLGRVRIGDDRQSLDEGALVLLHEMVHALQDQRLGLGEVYETERDIDAGNAFRALVEGDATLAMMGYVATSLGATLSALTRNPAVLRQAVTQASPLPGEELESAPPIVKEPLLSAYLDGMIFCAELHARGGFRRIDEAHRSVPLSTEQILHPEKYMRGEAPERIELPQLPALERAGLTPYRDETIGELEMRIYFGQSQPTHEARRAAAGWAGDRVRVFRTSSGAAGAVVWFTIWDTEPDAREAEAAAQRVMASVAPDRRATHVVERVGRSVLMVRGAPPATHASITAAFRQWAATH